jgi:cold shock CspA family protein
VEGVVRFYHEDKRYGFIRPDSREDDVYFNNQSLKSLRYRPAAGDRVVFGTEQLIQGVQAKNVEFLELSWNGWPPCYTPKE